LEERFKDSLERLLKRVTEELPHRNMGKRSSGTPD
jgi:hypothetical protein